MAYHNVRLLPLTKYLNAYRVSELSDAVEMGFQVGNICNFIASKNLIISSLTVNNELWHNHNISIDITYYEPNVTNPMPLTISIKPNHIIVLLDNGQLVSKTVKELALELNMHLEEN